MENEIKGGKADKMSLEDIARKHSVFLGTIKKELEMGLKVEREHTTDPEKAREIAMDHLVEFPDYYSRLDKMEKEATSKQKETKETTMAGASGSYEAPMSRPVTKKEIENFKLKSEPKQEPKESVTASVSAGAMYDAPIGHKQKDPLAIDNPTMKKVEEEGPIMGNKKLDAKANLKLPKWVKGGKYVAVNRTPTNQIGRNSGDPRNYTIYENPVMKRAIQEAAKKYGISEEDVLGIIINKRKNIKDKPE